MKNSKRIGNRKGLVVLKKIGAVGFIQIILIIAIIVLLPVFINCKIDLNILAVIIAILALLVPLLNEVNKAIDANRKVCIFRVTAEMYNTNLGELIDKTVNELRQQNKIIDSIKIIDDKNRGRSFSELIIIYH
ncbi:hypothetical protein [Clostridium estertheticum]|uniref:Uncharacterized protein n=1 Tax=Clostridium estertheticum subsp. estertheticum TaxID=1552 RepID=A0A1J0GJI4_9CLOT|nr:hypothetical protein [Clostridium estertheticum]APC41517.1 hypothetical protein A7L45_16250 [Clostridium estertheticum subsp. estertheticum]